MSEAAATADRPPSPQDRLLERLGRWLVARRVALLWAVAILTAVAAIPASRLELDESIEAFFSPSDPLIQSYQASRRAFGGDEFVLVAFEEEHPASSDQLDEVAEFSKALSAVPGIQSDSTQDLARTLREPSAALKSLPRLLQLGAQRALRAKLIEFSRHVLIGDNDDASAIVLRLLPKDESPVPRNETFRRIRELAAQHDPPAYVAGEPVQVYDMFRYVERDSRVLGIASTFLMMLVILLLFRSLRWVVLPIIIVHVTLIWTKAILFAVGLKLSMVSSMLTSLLTIIGIATVMHITMEYREARTRLDREGAFVWMFARVASPVFWVTVTTVVGFAALLCSDITPIRSFSWMMSIGVSLLLITFPMILPGGILIGRFQAEPRPTAIDQKIEGLLDRISHWVDRHSRLTLVVTALLSLIAGVGCLLQSIETDFSKNFKANSPIVQSIRFFESRLGGVGSWEINFEAPRELTTEYIDRVRLLTQRLNDLELPDGARLTKVVSFTEGLDFVPSLIAEDWSVKREWLRDLQPEFERSLYNSDEQRMRIVLRALEQQPAERKLELIRNVEATAREIFPDARATGLYVLLANLIKTILGDQLVSAVIAAAGIVGCVWIEFRSLRIAMITLAPNVLPILLVVGGIGWAGTPINIGAAMVASVSLGLTVDSSILYLADYLRARREGMTHNEAVSRAHSGAGLALVMATLALMAGFAILTLSEFIPLVFFGALVSVAMAGGLVGNLVLLPLMLRWISLDSAAPKPVEETPAQVTNAR